MIVLFTFSSAKIYHDVGLLYISEKHYQSAAECCEQALRCLEQSSKPDRSLEATVLQNLGAVCNHLKIYDRAAYFHKMSADLYGKWCATFTLLPHLI